MKKVLKPADIVVEEPSLQLVLSKYMKRELRDFVFEQGRIALWQMLEDERTVLCGPAYERGVKGPKRSGSTRGRLVMGGRRITVKRPRVRGDDGDLTLPSWVAFAQDDPLDKRALEQMILGVSTRKYHRSLEEVPKDLSASGTSKSAVSRRFVAATRKQLAEFLLRPLGPLDLAVILIDGIVIDKHVVVLAIGIDHEGDKHVLGFWEGATENTATCQALLENLMKRGLDAHRSFLFVIDGSKALRKAIDNTFGKRALVQRCQVHKMRNVLAHLPKEMQSSIRQLMREAYKSSSHDVAARRLKQTAAQLEEEYPSAAASLREGLAETLTVMRLGLPPLLRRTLASTNIIENLNSSVRTTTGRVKRWKGGRMILRWSAAAVLEAESKFRRIRGHKDMKTLVSFLSQHQKHIEEELDQPREAA